MSRAKKKNLMLNLERLEELRDFLLEHPERHDQGHWINPEGRYEIDPKLHARVPVVDCQTTMCMAGWAATLAGDRFVTTYSVLVSAKEAAKSEHAYETPGLGYTVTAPERAAELLGLTYKRKNKLFYMMNNELALKYLAKLIRKARAAQLVDA